MSIDTLGYHWHTGAGHFIFQQEGLSVKKYTFVAGCAAGEYQLGLVAKALRDKGVEVATALDVTQGRTEGELQALIKGADCVVVSMAPSQEAARPELLAVRIAAELGVKVYCYADTFGTPFREWFKCVAGQVTGVFLPSVLDKDRAQERYPNAAMHVVGNPEWYHQRRPSKSRAKARALLNIPKEAIVILYGGTKQEFPDTWVLGMLANAMLRLERKKPWYVVYTFHPRTLLFGPEKRDELVVRQVMEAMVRLPAMQNPNGTVMIAPKDIGTEIVQCAADVVTESMSATGPIACARRQPLMTFLPPMLQEHQEFLEGGGPVAYPLVDFGASVPGHFYAPDLLCAKLNQLLAPDSRLCRQQREAQLNLINTSTDPAKSMCDILLR